MAARKSCTHLTWSEAKNKSGIGSSSSSNKKNKAVLRKQDHGQVLAQKIIAKQQQGGSSDDKKIAKAYRKQEEKAMALAAQRLEERERIRLESLQEVQLYEKANEKVKQVLQELRENEEEEDDDNNIPTFPMMNDNDNDNVNHTHVLVECKQMQVDEIMALQAMVPEEDLVISNASKLAELEEKLENNNDDDDDDDQDAIANHPPISLYLKLDIDDYRDNNDNDNTTRMMMMMELNALIIVQITLPPLYLNTMEDSPTIIDNDNDDDITTTLILPQWKIIHCMVTDKRTMCSQDKPLESLAWLDESKLIHAMNQRAHELLSYPCVYEVAVTWLSENIFDYLHLHPHILATTSTTTTTTTTTSTTSTSSE